MPSNYTDEIFMPSNYTDEDLTNQQTTFEPGMFSGPKVRFTSNAWIREASVEIFIGDEKNGAKTMIRREDIELLAKMFPAMKPAYSMEEDAKRTFDHLRRAIRELVPQVRP